MTYEHVKQRAKERLNLELTDFDIDCITQMIKDNDCEYIGNHTFIIRFKKRFFKVVYKKTIRTVLAIT
jgi:hypothetical protein